MTPDDRVHDDGLARLHAGGLRLEGVSVAGSETFVALPELSVSFDIGVCPPVVLAADTIALTHGHADHAAGLLYYMAQRYRTRMGPGTVVCHPQLTDAIRQLALCGAQLEGHSTPVNVVALPPEATLDLDEGHRLRGFATHHTVPSLGFLIERRDASPDQPPLVAYTGDTAWGACFQRHDLLHARVLITECTFLRRTERQSAKLGGHLHLDHLRGVLERSRAEVILLTHLPRTIPVERIRRMLRHALPERHHARLSLLMDHTRPGTRPSAEGELPSRRSVSDCG